MLLYSVFMEQSRGWLSRFVGKGIEGMVGIAGMEDRGYGEQSMADTVGRAGTAERT
jgi:hypothetical protein